LTVWGVGVVLVQIDGSAVCYYGVCCWLWFAMRVFEHRAVHVGSAGDAGAIRQPGL